MLLNKLQEVTTAIIGSVGVVFSIQDVNELLNLLLLIFSIGNILIVGYTKIANLIKSKGDDLDLKEVSDVVVEVIEDIKELTDEKKIKWFILNF